MIYSIEHINFTLIFFIILICVLTFNMLIIFVTFVINVGRAMSRV